MLGGERLAFSRRQCFFNKPRSISAKRLSGLKICRWPQCCYLLQLRACYGSVCTPKRRGVPCACMVGWTGKYAEKHSANCPATVWPGRLAASKQANKQTSTDGETQTTLSTTDPANQLDLMNQQGPALLVLPCSAAKPQSRKRLAWHFRHAAHANQDKYQYARCSN